MDHPDQRQHQHQQQQHAMGIPPGSNQMVYPSPYHPAPIVVTGSPAMPASSPPTTYPGPQQLTYPQGPQFQSPQQQQQLQAFWANQMQEIEHTIDFKNHSLPLARIKKIMKADEDVRMISAEAPVIFAKACEMFVLELTLRSWIHTEENKRRTLQKNDIAAAISRTDVFDFLVDIIPRDELKEEGLGITKAGFPMGSPTDAGLPYYYVPSGGVYAGQHHPPPATLPFMPWSQPPAQQSSSQQQEQQPSD